MKHFKYCMCKSSKAQDESVDESSEVVLGEVGSRCEEHERRCPDERHAEQCPHTLKWRMSPSGGESIDVGRLIC